MKSAQYAAVALVVALAFARCVPGSGGGGGGGGGGGQDAGDAGAQSDAGDRGDAGLPGDGGTPIDASPGQWAWIPVEGSQCASGSTAGIGVNLADSDDVFIFMQGGGACWNQGTCIPSLLQYGPLCDYGTFCLLNTAGGQQPTATHVTEHDPFPRDGGGSFPSEISQLRTSAIFDRNNPDNPFRNATFVFVPYCTGDLHGGDSSKTYSYQYGLFDPVYSYTVHFAGARNMDLYLQRLHATVPNARRIWLTGASAGGYGATLNFDRVQRAFSQAEVHLLADSSPFLQGTPHWQEWRDTWSLQLPPGCDGCDAGFPQIMDHLAQAYPSRRMGLLAYDQDHTIAWYFYAAPGAGNFLNPPVGTYGNALGALETAYDGRSNTKYFVIPGTDHVLLPGYGTVTADGGVTTPLPSHDGGTTLRAWVNDWATGAPGWTSTR